MRAFVSIIITALFAVIGVKAQTTELTVEALNSGKYTVKGALGIPLGHAVEVTGRIVAGEAYDRLWVARYCLQIETVAGRAVTDGPVLRFDGLSAGVPATHFELAEDLNGAKVHRLTFSECQELDKRYVGTWKRLVVVEYGEFSGMPIGGSPDDCLKMSGGRQFGFTTYLDGLADRTSEPTGEKKERAVEATDTSKRT